MSAKRISWQEIEKLYPKQWVELVDYDWPNDAQNPISGIVRSHSANHKTFYTKANKEPRPTDSAILFVGNVSAPAGTIFCSSLAKIEHA